MTENNPQYSRAQIEQVKALRAEMKCGLYVAKVALEMNNWEYELAKEHSKILLEEYNAERDRVLREED